jgi:microcystin-dependent protein
MSQPYVGEIRMFGGNFQINGWAFCNGALLAISQNDVLFQLIGTTYGGDGQVTFQLPDLQGRFPIHQGTGAGLSTYVIGERAGTETVTLNANQIPAHSHPAAANAKSGGNGSPANNYWAGSSGTVYSSAAPDASMAGGAIGNAGGNQPHENMMPFLCVTFLISLFGIFPSQT